MKSENNLMVQALIDNGVLSTPNIINAFKKTNRQDFIIEDYKEKAYLDIALPIGFGQTISQPYTVAFMLELLNSQKGNKILDVGSGSGWTTVLLAHLVGLKGEVIGIEIISELVKFGQKNLKKYKLKQAKIMSISKSLKYLGYEIFDRILVSASAPKLPDGLVNQLKIGGTMVIPIEDSIWKVTKKEDNQLNIEKYKGFNFVPYM